jgi:hypothetical protein
MLSQAATVRIPVIRWNIFRAEADKLVYLPVATDIRNPCINRLTAL